MRVVMLSPCLHEREYGGVQRAGQMAWDAMRDLEPRLLAYGKRCQGGYDRTRETCTSSRIRAVSAAVLLRNVKVALVWHLHLLKVVPLMRPRKIVAFLHGIEGWRALDAVGERMLSRVDLFLANSEFTWRRFLEHHPQCIGRRHEIVPLGFGSPVEGGIEQPSRSPAAVIVGRMIGAEDYKGHRQLLQAWPNVLQRIPDAQLWVIGEGALKNEFENLAAAAGIARSVRFFGAISDSHKEDLLRLSRCLAMPSRGEGFGLVYLEAMRIGRPCLVSTLDAGREVVEPPEAGLAVDPQDGEALASALVTLLSLGPEWDAFSGRAAERYRSRFTAAHFQRRFLAALTTA